MPREDTNGTVQPIRVQYACICSSGMFDAVNQLTSSSARVARPATLLVKKVQPGQKLSGPLSMNW